MLDAGCGYAYASFGWLIIVPVGRFGELMSDPETVNRNLQAAYCLGLENLCFRVGDVARLEVDVSFDLIFSIDVLEHLEDDVGALSTWRQSMSRAGWLVLHLPLRHQIQRVYFPSSDNTLSPITFVMSIRRERLRLCWLRLVLLFIQ